MNGARMTAVKFLTFLLFVVCGASAGRALPSLERGVNVNRPFLEVHGDAKSPAGLAFVAWDGAATDACLAKLRQDGFRTIRLNVNVEPLISGADRPRRIAEGEVVDFVRRSIRAGLTVVVSLYTPTLFAPGGKQTEESEQTFSRYLTAVSSLAATLGRLPADKIAIEPVNEPPPPCVWPADHGWPEAQRIVFAAVRKAAPTLAYVATGACWSGIDGLTRISPKDFDRATLFTFHFYEPYLFTHEGLAYEKGPVKYMTGIHFPARPQDRTPIEQDFDAAVGKLGSAEAETLKKEGRKEIERYFQVEAYPSYVAKRLERVHQWQVENGLPANRVFVGEFGVAGVDKVDDGEAQRAGKLDWVRIVRTDAEKLGFSWAIYSLLGPFGVKDNPASSTDKALAAALGIN